MRTDQAPAYFFGQDRPAELCRGRAVRPREYYTLNQIFGFDRLLKAYADLPPYEPLPWGMEHFISFGDPAVFPNDRACRLPCHLAVTEEQAEALRRAGRPHVVAVGSAYFYMRALLERWFPDLPAAPPRRGTLVFPDKSTTHKNLDFDRARFAATLAALPEAFQPVAVSVFWKDYERGAHRPFEEAGLSVVSSGHPYDPLFLFRQYDLCRRFRWACSNKAATSFCMAVLAGCRWFHLPGGAVRVQRKGKRVEEFAEDPTHALPGKRLCLEASPFPPPLEAEEADAAWETQRALAERYAGREYVRSPEYLRGLWEEHRRGLSRGNAPDVHYKKTLLRRRKTPRDLAARWLPAGVDADGWAGSRTRLTLPAATPAAGAEVTFVVPRAAGFGKRGAARRRAAWRITLDGAAAYAWRPSAGRFTLLLPAPAAGRTQAVEIETADDAALPDGLRRRAFRIESIRSVAAPSARPASAAGPAVRSHALWGAPVGCFGPLETLQRLVETAPSDPPGRSFPASGASASADGAAPPGWREWCDARPDASAAALDGLPSLADAFDRVQVVDHPFPFFTERKFLPEAWAVRLSEAVPSLATLAAGRRLGPAAQGYVRGLDLLARNDFAPVWKAFLREATSASFYRGVMRAFRPAVARLHPELLTRYGALEELAPAPRQRYSAAHGQVGVECQLAFHTPSTKGGVVVRPPHLDQPNKLLVLMIRIRAAEDDAHGGELELCIPHDEPHLYGAGRRLPNDAVDPVRRFENENNLAVAFLNTPASLHRVAPRAPSALPAVYVDWVVEFPEPLFAIPCGDPVDAAPSAEKIRKPSWFKRIFSSRLP